MNFDNKKVVATAQVPLNFTAQQIFYLVCGALEGGIGYWAQLQNDRKEWSDKPKDVTISSWATKILLEGGTIYFRDEENMESEKWKVVYQRKANAMEICASCYYEFDLDEDVYVDNEDDLLCKECVEDDTLGFKNTEEEKDNEVDLPLTLDKLMEGVKLNAVNRPFDSDLENADATTNDCIFQYAIFGEVIYG